MIRNKEDEKYIRFLWSKNLPVIQKNISLLKILVKQQKIKIDVKQDKR